MMFDLSSEVTLAINKLLYDEYFSVEFFLRSLSMCVRSRFLFVMVIMFLSMKNNFLVEKVHNQ